MSISFAGLGIISFKNPFTELASLVVGKGDIRSILCLLVFSIISLLLAYLTNPSENSFRAYLTEQSFRHHLSRLDENCEDPTNNPQEITRQITPPKVSAIAHGHILPFDGSFPFHFANRASISLRTPKHVFHSFGIFTVAAMIPLPKSSISDDRDAPMIADSWYIGAFGKWWRGGILETWYQDVISRSKDEESWRSGVLSIKSLDMFQDFPGSAAKIGISDRFTHVSPPRPRHRDRTSCKNPSTAPRSPTPPPLSKSASLPLHTTRPAPSTSEQPSVLVPHPPSSQPSQPLNVSESDVVAASAPSRLPSTLFDQQPRIVHVLDQISATKSSLVDLRTQLQDSQTSVAQTHTLLQEEVNSYRERKRIEDASKIETKSRTKTLEDSKRSAEAVKREADKKFKTAQSTHDQAAQRIRSFDNEIVALKERACTDEETLRHSVDEASPAERALMEEFETKKQEVKDAEDIVAALNQRARELEDQLNAEREKLNNKSASVENRKMRRLQYVAPEPSQAVVPQDGIVDSASTSQDSHYQPILDPVVDLAQFRPHLSFGAVSSPTGNVTSRDDFSYESAYSLPGFKDEVAKTFGLPITSPTSQLLIPSGLITSLDHVDSLPTSRSFQSDTDPYLSQDWHGSSTYMTPSNEGYDISRSYGPFTTEPTSFVDPSLPSPRRHSLDGHAYSVAYEDGHSNGLTEPSSDSAPGFWPALGQPSDHLMLPEPMQYNPGSQKRRWFPTLSKDKPKKGLNPDAKEFSLSKAHPTSPYQSLPSFDNLNPTSIGSSIMSSSSSSTNESLFLRAFAPSPAEREALQRALGGANTSFERLPSLCDVGSIPSSPSHIHTLPIAPSSHASKLLPSWFPRGRKAQFSPWDDEEPTNKTSRTKP